MGILDGLLGQAGKLDLGALAAQVGLSPEELANGGEALLSKLAGGGVDAGDAAQHAAAETGISADKLQALIPALAAHLGSEGGIQGLLGQLTGSGGLLASLDKDGDGNPLNDITGMAKGLFG